MGTHTSHSPSDALTVFGLQSGTLTNLLHFCLLFDFENTFICQNNMRLETQMWHFYLLCRAMCSNLIQTNKNSCTILFLKDLSTICCRFVCFVVIFLSKCTLVPVWLLTTYWAPSKIGDQDRSRPCPKPLQKKGLIQCFHQYHQAISKGFGPLHHKWCSSHE